jgi:hypothetical protein
LARNRSKSSKEKSDKEDADGLEEAVVAGNLGKRRKSGFGNASES